MNCQEIMQIVDDQGPTRLSVAATSAAEAHIAGCAECALQVDMHRRLAALRTPPLAPSQIASWRAVAVSGAHVRHSQRKRSRLALVATMAAFAAAAALAVLRDVVPRKPDAATLPSEPQPVDIALQSVRSAGGVPDAADLSLVQARGPVDQNAVKQLPGSFTVLVLPLQHETEDLATRALGEEYYTGLLARLRQIPGLILVSQDQSTDARTEPVDFRLTVTSAYGKVPERFGGHEQWLQSLIAHAHRRGSASSYAQVMGLSIDPACGRPSSAKASVNPGCTPSGLIEIGIQQLRSYVFPPDSATMSQLRARFLDTAQPQSVRQQALTTLLDLGQRAAGEMDAELIRVIVHDAIANAAGSAQRVRLWRALRGQANAVLIQPLLEQSRLEIDDSVRLEVVGLLATDFRTDPVARSGLEQIAWSDPNPLVRKVAERAVSGDAPWRKYVVESVADTTLPLTKRLEPLAWMADLSGSRTADAGMEAEFAAVAREVFASGGIEALADVLTKAGNGPTRAASAALWARFSSVQHPAVVDLLLAGLGSAPDLIRISALERRRDDPRIEAALKNLAANHPDANMRQTITLMLSKPPISTSASTER